MAQSLPFLNIMTKTSFLLSLVLILGSSAAYSVDSCLALFRGERKGTTDVRFTEKIGQIEEHTLRAAQTAAHVYFDSTQEPYFFVGFPAGNSGVAVWMKTASGVAHLEAISTPHAVQEAGGLNGVELQARSGVKKLIVTDSVLGSMRFIRDRELGLPIPPEVAGQNIRFQSGKLIYERESLNGLARYILELEPIGDTHIMPKGNSYEIASNSEARFKLRAFTSEIPLTPLRIDEVFKENVIKHMDQKKLEAFSFLLYKEKLMAGSPRYFSKFGRDSIYTLRVLMDVMKPEAIESLLAATFSSMHPSKGLVSHEQHEGDFVSYVRMKRHQKYKGVNQPMEDYKMIDDDFAFTIVLSEYMKRYPERVKGFLDRKDQRGFRQRDLTKNLFRYVIQVTSAFAKNPIYKNLVGLKGHEPTGEWRDSENGLGGGRYPFDVNAAFVPATLKALADLSSDRTSEFFDASLASNLRRSFNIWNTHAARLFEVRIPSEKAKAYGEAYLNRLGINPRDLPSAPNTDIVFPAISLDANGRPIPIMHSDDSLMMTFGYPSEAYLRGVSQRIRGQFPYGLGTPVGILVANPVFASRDLQTKFDETKYHGRVSWTMQEDLLVNGIRRQLKRDDLSDEVKQSLKLSELAIEKVAAAKAEMGGTEVFSIFYRNGHYEAIPFSGDAKSNSNQLWSHLRLGLSLTANPR